MENTDSPATTTNPTPEAPPSPLLTFLNYIKKLKSFESERVNIRVTPKGLFVHEKAAESLVAVYQQWIEEQSEGLARKAHDKAWNKLFGTEHPDRQYLVEGKNSLTGYLIQFEVKNPQQYGLPYYLGSLLSGQSYLHPADPLLSTLKDVELINSNSGFVLRVVSRGVEVEITQNVLQHFSKLCEFSRLAKSKKVFESDPLVVKARLLVTLVKRSRALKIDTPILVPARFKEAKGKNRNQLRIAASFVFVIEGREIKSIYELTGRNLGEFLRRELISGPKQQLGTFRLSSERERILGFAQLKDVRVAVHPKAFTEFVEYIMRATEPRERFIQRYTAQDCFERFMSFVQLAQSMPIGKFKAVFQENGVDARSCRVYGAWVFVAEQDGSLKRVVARHIRMSRVRRRK